MSDATIPPDDRPFGADTDEAVSAHLDGELAGFAAAHGIDEAEARRRLDAWPAFAARAAAFDRARTEIAAAPPLDDVARRRIVRAALEGDDALPRPAAAGRAGHARALAWIGAAAAAVAIVVGIGVVVSRAPDDDAARSESAGRAVATAPRAPEGALGDIGDVTDPASLRALLGERDEAADAPSETPTEAPTDTGADSGAGRVPAAEHNAARDDGVSRARIDACAATIAGGAPVRFTATGTFNGEPVVVVGVTRDGRTIVFVVPPDDCTRILSSVSR